MIQNVKNSGDNIANRFVGRLAAEKKKTVMALCLIALMIFMWVRVLSQKTPEVAAAAPGQKSIDQDILDSDLALNISFIELPKVAGRNDVLTRDFFAADGWKDFLRDQQDVGIEKVNVVSQGGNEEVVELVAEKLKLEAIGLDGNPQAFINGKLLSVGDKLLVRDGGNKYECEVVEIAENVVVIKCGEAEISLKVMKAVEVTE
ncbi:MAG: hypothetical protein ACYSR9_07050 [Planctomycetota bacterium]|jgi:hypothetical protein